MTAMSKRTINNILNSKFMKRSKVVLFGSVVSQLITFVTSFVITAYFTPVDLGMLGTLTALVSVIAGTLSFRFELAIISEEQEKAPTLFLQTSIFSCFFTLIFCLFCLVLPWDFAKKISEYFVPFLLWTWGYLIFFNSRQLPFRFDHMSAASMGSIARNLFTLVFQLVGGILNPSFSWLLTGRISGDYVGAAVHLKKYIKLMSLKDAVSGWGPFIRRFKDYFLYMTPHHFCLALSSNVIVFFIERGYGLAAVGFYALAQRLIQAPIEVLSASLFNVTVQRFSELKNDIQELKTFYIKVVFFSLTISIVIGIGIWGTIDYFIPLLGSKWSQSSETVKSLIPSFMSFLFFTPTLNFLRFINKAKLQLSVEILELILKVVFLSTMNFDTADGLILNFGILTFGMSILKTIYFFRLIPKKA